MSNYNEIKRILDSFGKKLVADLQKSLEGKLNTKASKYGSKRTEKSRLGANTTFEFSPKENALSFNLLMPNYWRFVDNGRKAGNVAESANIDSWAKTSGVVEAFRLKDLKTRLEKAKKKKDLKKMAFDKATKQIDYLVRRKLKQKGYEGNDFYKEVINDGRMAKLESELIDKVQSDLIIEFRK